MYPPPQLPDLKKLVLGKANWKRVKNVRDVWFIIASWQG